MKILKIDYDRRNIKKMFYYRAKSIYRVYYTKRTYLPVIEVTAVYRTRKGWHVIVNFTDLEPNDFGGADKLLLQDMFGSDITRTGFDRLRLQRNETVNNLLFGFKNGRKVIKDNGMKQALNKQLMLAKKKFDSINYYKLHMTCVACGKKIDIKVNQSETVNFRTWQCPSCKVYNNAVIA